MLKSKNPGKTLIGVLLFLMFISFGIGANKLKLTRIKCNVSDSSFAKFELCRVKAESRFVQYYQVHIKFLELPITDMHIRLQFQKRANGYKPFLYNVVLRCDFIKHLNPITTILWGWISKNSNLNHSCPITEDFIINRLENNFLQQELISLPLINGDYLFVSTFGAYNITRFSIEFYGTFS